MSAVEEAKTVPTTETVEELKEQQKGMFITFKNLKI